MAHNFANYTFCIFSRIGRSQSVREILRALNINHGARTGARENLVVTPPPALFAIRASSVEGVEFRLSKRKNVLSAKRAV